MLYQTLISPKFDYADIIWGGCSVKNEKYLQSAQNYAVKSILGKRKYDSGSEALKELKLINLKKRRMVHEAVFAHNRYSNYKSKFNTRNSYKNKLNIPQHNSTKYKKSPLYRTIKSWNKSLPFTDLGNIKKHKEAFQESLIENNP